MPNYSKRTSRLPALKFSTPEGVFSVRVRSLNDEWLNEPLDIPTRMCMDFLTLQHGGVQFQPAFDRKLVSWDEQSVSTPDDIGEDGKPRYQYCLVAPIYVEAHRTLYELMATGAYMTGCISDLADMFFRSGEATQGLLPVLDWVGVRENKVDAGPAKGKKFYTPKLEVAGWIPRHTAIFGPQTVATPKPAVALPSIGAPMQITADKPIAPAVPVAAVADELNDAVPFYNRNGDAEVAP